MTTAAAPAASICAMTIGGSLFLIAVGAILHFAVTAELAGIDIQVVGTILMIVGVIGFVLGLIFLTPPCRPASLSAEPRSRPGERSERAQPRVRYDTAVGALDRFAQRDRPAVLEHYDRRTGIARHRVRDVLESNTEPNQ